jgi:multicomponent Na+:H+ antiporter subunit B
MNPRARLALFAVAAVGLAALLVWGLAGLPSFGHYEGRYGRIIARNTVPQRKATDAVGVTTFDYRGIDTLGEEFILLVAVLGVMALLRAHRDESDESRARAQELERIRKAPVPSESLTLLGQTLAPIVLVLGIYIVAHGHLTPGGGFQGGVVLAAALLILYLTTGRTAFRRLRAVETFEATEALGAAGYALIGVGGLIAGAAFLHNFLPHGHSGLLTGGIVPLANVSVGFAVAGAIATILSEMLDQDLLRRRGRR